MKRVFQIVPGGSSIRATTPYRVVEMDLKKIMAFVMLVLMVIPSFGMAMGETMLTVETDSSSYEPGEDVEITGTVEPNASVSIIVIVNETKDTIFNESISADEDGKYSGIFNLPIDAFEGIYNVSAYNVTKAETFFVVSSEPPDSEPTDSDPSDEETAVGLSCAIERAYIFIGKVEATVERLEEKGYEVQDIEDNLTDAISYLDAAEEFLDLLNVEAAELEFSKAREILGSTMGWLHSTAKKVKLTRAEHFMEQFQRHIQNINGTLLRIQERLEVDVTARARGVLKSTMNRLNQLRRRMDVKMIDGDLDVALDELENMVEDIVDEFGDIIRGNRKGP